MTTNSQTYFIDANIMMYAAGSPHPLKQSCFQLLRDFQRPEVTFVTSVEVYQEILHRYGALKRRTQAITVCQNLTVITSQILPVEWSDIQRAFIVFQQHSAMKARDCIHAATMYNNGLTHILSADRHFDSLHGITRIDPLDWSTHLKQRLSPSSNGT